MARGEPPRPGTQLPAPYRNPWSSLAEALGAVLADRRLALQRQWRRNVEGDLPLPGFWPRGLAPLFWPLLLALTLLLITVPLSLLKSTGRLPPQQQVPPPLAAPPVEGRATPDGLSSRPPSDRAAREGEANPDRAPRRPGEPAGEGLAGPQPVAAPAAAATPGADSAMAGEAVASPPELQLDPLLELLREGEDGGLLLAARPQPALGLLRLTLSEAAETLAPATLLKRAEHWQQQARQAGYERLELRDRQGRLRGRQALVGSGMILLAPVPAA